MSSCLPLVLTLNTAICFNASIRCRCLMRSTVLRPCQRNNHRSMSALMSRSPPWRAKMPTSAKLVHTDVNHDRPEAGCSALVVRSTVLWGMQEAVRFRV